MLVSLMGMSVRGGEEYGRRWHRLAHDIEEVGDASLFNVVILSLDLGV